MKMLVSKIKALVLTGTMIFGLFFSSSGIAVLSALFKPMDNLNEPYVLMVEDVFFRVLNDCDDKIIIVLKTPGNISRKIKIPETMNVDGKDYEVAAVGARGFSKCEWLEEIYIPSTVEFIGTYAFGECYNLKRVTIAGSLEFIGKAAFYSCHNLERVYIGGNVYEISTEAFCFCKKLKDIFYFGYTRPKINDLAFLEAYNNINVHVRENYEYENFGSYGVIKGLKDESFSDEYGEDRSVSEGSFSYDADVSSECMYDILDETFFN